MRISDWSSDVCSSDLLVAHSNSRVDAEFKHANQPDGTPLTLSNDQRRQTAPHRRCLDNRGIGLSLIHQRIQNGVELLHRAHAQASHKAVFPRDLVALGELGNCPDPTLDGMHLPGRSEEHTSELQSLMRISYAVFCLKKKN